ncbi:hypothetical protein JTE90_000434 [Oedothorax gibbosus]|uniref:Uncharacterized protein n=1 Tax=Oedothorax gibbosus TaxID=931172 RepID=A0AAV6UEK3_9ARAC|nr:hypothetical protein JTE90_000434 [Oedothorax gibbosus]
MIRKKYKKDDVSDRSGIYDPYICYKDPDDWPSDTVADGKEKDYWIVKNRNIPPHCKVPEWIKMSYWTKNLKLESESKE